MKFLLLAAMVLGSILTLLGPAVPRASAGRNGGGSIVVHTTDAYTYLSTTVCTSTLSVPASCAAAGTRTDKDTAAVVWFLASFVPEATPAVAHIYFGLNFDAVNLDPSTKYGSCPPGGVEVPDAGWPGGDPIPGISGNTVGFGTPVTGSTLFVFYYFKVDDFSGGPPAEPFLCSAVNPTGGYAKFYDDAFPPVEDAITRFGCVKWYADTGSNTCPVPPPTGACCLNTALCVIVGSKNECDALSGVYQGDDTICDNPCSACCYWAGDPIQRYCVVTTESDCTTGTWNDVKINVEGVIVGANWSDLRPGGAGHECATDSSQAGMKWWCQDPRDFNPAGACCLNDGSCYLSNQEGCHAAGGYLLGYGTSCEPYPCLAIQGACCQPDGTCTVSSVPDCLSPGIWQGGGSVCNPNPCLTGACCLAGYCLRTSEPECAGYAGVYLGNATSCAPSPCPTVGACCQSDGSCRLTIQVSCGSPTNWLGAGSTCSPNPCALGACCAEDGTCLLSYQTVCLPPSTWQGGSAFCNPNPCPPGGTCCHQDGTCLVSTLANCHSPGVWQGGATVCTPNPCPPGGACCGLDGTCVVLTQASCVPPRIWQSGGSTCAPNPCPPVGACCQSDGTCTATLQANCPLSAIWQGADTTCNPNPCTTGACCLAGYCLRCTQSVCGGYGGTYEGNGHLCEPNPCPTSAADQTSQNPARLTLSAAPVPSSGETSILYQLPATETVTVEIFDASGSLVRRLSEGSRPAGSFVARWDGRDENGRDLPGGVFFVRIVTANGTATGRVVLTK